MVAVLLSLPWPAQGADRSGTEALPLRLSAVARLRYEQLDESGPRRQADALTLRVRPRLDMPIDGQLALHAELEAIAALTDHYDDLVGRARPVSVIPDAETLALNQLAFTWQFSPKAAVVAGRQRLALDDERFIGAVDFRQNDQTMDALSVQLRSPGGLTFDGAYVHRVHRIFGRHSDHDDFEGNSFLANLGVPTPAGRLTAYLYALDLDAGRRVDNRHGASSLTGGVRLEGRRPSERLGWRWEAAWARQRDYADQPASYNADYWLLGAAATHSSRGIRTPEGKAGSRRRGGVSHAPRHAARFPRGRRPVPEAAAEQPGGLAGVDQLAASGSALAARAARLRTLPPL